MKKLNLIILLTFLSVLTLGLVSCESTQNNLEKNKIEEKIVMSEEQIRIIVNEMNDFKPNTGYIGTPIWENRIKFVVNDYVVIDLNEFGNQFLQNEIDLKWSEILKIHRFIHYISLKPKIYRDYIIDLYKAHKILNEIN